MTESRLGVTGIGGSIGAGPCGFVVACCESKLSAQAPQKPQLQGSPGEADTQINTAIGLSRPGAGRTKDEVRSEESRRAGTAENFEETRVTRF